MASDTVHSPDVLADRYRTLLRTEKRISIADFLQTVSGQHGPGLLITLIRIDMEERAALGEPVRVEDYLALASTTDERHQLVDQIVADELRVRTQYGKQLSLPDILNRLAGPANALIAEGDQLTDSLADQRLQQINCGDEIAGFHIRTLLGGSGPSQVFMAEESGSGRLVALKISHRTNPEAEILKRLSHESIVPILSQQTVGSSNLLVMPYIEGVSVAELLGSVETRDRRRLTAVDIASVLGGDSDDLNRKLTAGSRRGRWFERFICRLIHDTACGLAHAHGRGIIHRDVKPENIVLSRAGRPLLIDFNVAVQPEKDSAAASRFVGGTLPWMSPEQLRLIAGLDDTPGRDTVTAAADARSDLYSLGVVFFELLTGALPFPVMEPAGSIVAAAREALSSRLEAKTTIQSRRDIPASLRAIILKCTADPSVTARIAGGPYESADQLAEDIQCWLDDKPLEHASEPWPLTGVSRWVRHHRVVVIAAVVAICTPILFFAGELLISSRQLNQLEHRLNNLAELPAGPAVDVPDELCSRIRDTGRFASFTSFKRRRSQLLHRLGAISLKHGQPRRAAEALEFAVELDSSSGAIWNDLGVSRFRCGLYDSAIEAFNEALKQNCNPAEVLANRGAAWGALNDTQRARQDFECALAIDPGCTAARENLRLLDLTQR